MSKTDYLDAFSFEFTKLCGGSHRVAGRWSQGMWTNAHMHYGLGTDVAEGARRFFDDIMKYKRNQRELVKLKAEAQLC